MISRAARPSSSPTAGRIPSNRELDPAWILLVNLAKARFARFGVRDFSPAFDGGIHPAAPAAREKKGGPINLKTAIGLSGTGDPPVELFGSEWHGRLAHVLGRRIDLCARITGESPVPHDPHGRVAHATQSANRDFQDKLARQKRDCSPALHAPKLRLLNFRMRQTHTIAFPRAMPCSLPRSPTHDSCD